MEKERWTNTLIKRAEAALIPGLSEMIEVKESATPLTNWRYTGNTDGAIYGFEQSMDNAYMNRISNRTPVKGLYPALPVTFLKNTTSGSCCCWGSFSVPSSLTSSAPVSE